MSSIAARGRQGVPAASAQIGGKRSQKIACLACSSNPQLGGKETFTSGTAVNMLPHYTVARWLQCINLCHMHVCRGGGGGVLKKETLALNTIFYNVFPVQDDFKAEKV